MSKRGDSQKGSRVEREFCDRLKDMGFVFDRAERSTRQVPAPPYQPCHTCHRMPTFTMSKKHDTFGMFDILAKHKDFKQFTFYFQIACNKWKGPADRQAMEEFPAGPNDIIAMVRKDDYQPFKIKLLTPGAVSKTGPWVEYTMYAFFNDQPFMKDEDALVE